MGLEGWGYEKTADNTEIEACKERALLLVATCATQLSSTINQTRILQGRKCKSQQLSRRASLERRNVAAARQSFLEEQSI